MFKKVLALMLVLLMVISLAACGEENGSSNLATGSDVVASTDVEDATQEETDGKEDKEDDKKEEASKTESTGSKTGGTASRVVNSRTGNTTGGVTQSDKNISAAVGNLKVKKGTSLTEELKKELTKKKNPTKITMAITEEFQYLTPAFNRCVAAFEKEYNVKVTLKQLKFDQYNKSVANQMTTGNSYDIAYIHGSMYPSCVVDNLYEDLTPHLRTGDLMDNDKPTAGGIDLNKTSYFATYKNKIYGTCNYSSVFPYLMYYNIKKFTDAGLQDPQKLANANRWTWTQIEQYGKKVTQADRGLYFLSNSITGRGLALSYDAPLVRVEKTKQASTGSIYVQNITSTGYLEAYKLMSRFMYGNNKIAEPLDSAHPQNDPSSFVEGNCFIFMEETSKYTNLVKEVKSSKGSAAFDKKKENIGIVKMPLGKTNKEKKYPTGWLTAVACGKGKDPRIAIAWDVFRSSYLDPISDPNDFSKKDKDYINTLLAGDISCEIGMFFNSSNDKIDQIESQIRSTAVQGGDVSSVAQSKKNIIDRSIKFTMTGK